MPRWLLFGLLATVAGSLYFTPEVVPQESAALMDTTESVSPTVPNSTVDVGDRLEHEKAPASPTLLDDTAAKMAFLAFLALVGVGYMYIRNKPTSVNLSIKKRRK